MSRFGLVLLLITTLLKIHWLFSLTLIEGISLVTYIITLCLLCFKIGREKGASDHADS
jgi:hypothetical protein